VGQGRHCTSSGLYFCIWKGYENQLGTGFFVRQRILPAVRRVEFVSDGICYIVLRGRWCDIIVLNAHAPTEDTIDR
jgi:hypothetical protein